MTMQTYLDGYPNGPDSAKQIGTDEWHARRVLTDFIENVTAATASARERAGEDDRYPEQFLGEAQRDRRMLPGTTRPWSGCAKPSRTCPPKFRRPRAGTTDGVSPRVRWRLGTDVGVSRRGVVTVVSVFELGRWDQADLAVRTMVVEPVDVLRDSELEVVDVLPRSLVAHQLGLEREVECLGQGVVVGVAGRADRGDAGLGQALGIANSDVLPGLLCRCDASARPRPDQPGCGSTAPSPRRPTRVRCAAIWRPASRPPGGRTRRSSVPYGVIR